MAVKRSLQGRCKPLETSFAGVQQALRRPLKGLFKASKTILIAFERRLKGFQKTFQRPVKGLSKYFLKAFERFVASIQNAL